VSEASYTPDMKPPIPPVPSGAEVKARLAKLEYAGLRALSEASGVSINTLYSIRDHAGDPNPGIDTVRRFLPHLPKLAA
jgi:hypothetical protein